MLFGANRFSDFSANFGQGDELIVIDEKIGVKRSILMHIVRLRDLLENVRSEAVRAQILNQIAELSREADMIANGR